MKKLAKFSSGNLSERDYMGI